jgi:hypothetical protein
LKGSAVKASMGRCLIIGRGNEGGTHVERNLAAPV